MRQRSWDHRTFAMGGQNVALSERGIRRCAAKFVAVNGPSWRAQRRMGMLAAPFLSIAGWTISSGHAGHRII
ncbi:hypothetical protein D3C71_1029680 [compost metagenome]